MHVAGSRLAACHAGVQGLVTVAARAAVQPVPENGGNVAQPRADSVPDKSGRTRPLHWASARSLRYFR